MPATAFFPYPRNISGACKSQAVTGQHLGSEDGLESVANLLFHHVIERLQHANLILLHCRSSAGLALHHRHRVIHCVTQPLVNTSAEVQNQVADRVLVCAAPCSDLFLRQAGEALVQAPRRVREFADRIVYKNPVHHRLLQNFF